MDELRVPIRSYGVETNKHHWDVTPGAASANAIDGGAEPPEVVFQAPTQHLLQSEPPEIEL